MRGKENISGLSKHIKDTNHNIDWDNIYVLNKENDFRKKKFKEAVAIRTMTKNNDEQKRRSKNNIFHLAKLDLKVNYQINVIV